MYVCQLQKTPDPFQACKLEGLRGSLPAHGTAVLLQCYNPQWTEPFHDFHSYQRKGQYKRLQYPASQDFWLLLERKPYEPCIWRKPASANVILYESSFL